MELSAISAAAHPMFVLGCELFCAAAAEMMAHIALIGPAPILGLGQPLSDVGAVKRRVSRFFRWRS
jgi:hypothetical protein